MQQTNATTEKTRKQPQQPPKGRREHEQEARGKQWNRDDKRSRYTLH